MKRGLFSFVTASAIASSGLSGVTVSVDYSIDLGPAQARACGFLHGVGEHTPDAALLRPLRLGLLRGPVESYLKPEFYERVHATGARLSVGLHGFVRRDISGHEGGVQWPGDGGNWAPWENYVRTCVQQSIDQKARFDYWLIWNEPNAHYWGRSIEQYREAYRRGYRVVRTMLPEASILGPVIDRFDAKWMFEYLLWCQENNCLPDVICWHELRHHDGSQIPSHVAELKEWLKANGIRINRFMVDEYASRKSYNRPGNLVGFFATIEQAGIERAAVGTYGPAYFMSGAAADDGKSPMPTWWVFKAYSDLTGRRVSAKSDANIAALAGFDAATNQSRILLGNCHDTSAAEVVLELKSLPGAGKLAANGSIQVTVESIPMRRTSPLAALQVAFTGKIAVSNGNTRITLPKCSAGEALVITVSGLSNG